MDNIIQRMVNNLPNRIPAVTVEDENGDYNIYINANLCYLLQREGLKHEYRHIRKKHFQSTKPIKLIEREADEDKKLQGRG